MNIAWRNLQVFYHFIFSSRLWQKFDDDVFLARYSFHRYRSIDDSLILIFRSFVNNFTNLEWDENICFVKILLR